MPVGAIIAAFLIYSSLILPQYRKTGELATRLKADKQGISTLKTKLKDLKTLPKFDVRLDTKADTMLSLKNIVDRKGFQLSEVAESSDSAGRYISFVIDINNYKSLAQIIVSLEKLNELLPVAYTKYVLANRSIKINARCYFRG